MIAFEKSCGLISLLEVADEGVVADWDVLIVELEELVAVSLVLAVDELALLVVAVLPVVDWVGAVLVGVEVARMVLAVASMRMTRRTGIRRPI
jgi:hypothetical protein